MLTAVYAHPVTQGAFIDAELLRHAGNRTRRLDHHLHGFLFEFGREALLRSRQLFTFPESPSYWMDCPEASGHLKAPSGRILRRMGSPLTGFETFLADGPASPAWKVVDLINASHTGAAPSININGWLDVGAYETVKLFEFQQHHPDQYLIMAPTEHCKMLATGPDARLGHRLMGDTRFPYDEIIISWFDRFLCDEAGAWQPMPKVQVFLMGACTWLTGESWPLPETEERTLFLASDSSANTLWGDGALAPAAGPAGQDEFVAD